MMLVIIRVPYLRSAWNCHNHYFTVRFNADAEGMPVQQINKKPKGEQYESSNQDKAEGKFHEVKGKVKEYAGKISDNPKLEAEGTVEKITGQFRKRSVRSRGLGAVVRTAYLASREATNWRDHHEWQSVSPLLDKG